VPLTYEELHAGLKNATSPGFPSRYRVSPNQTTARLDDKMQLVTQLSDANHARHLPDTYRVADVRCVRDRLMMWVRHDACIPLPATFKRVWLCRDFTLGSRVGGRTYLAS
jgi:hypothetical protein